MRRTLHPIVIAKIANRFTVIGRQTDKDRAVHVLRRVLSTTDHFLFTEPEPLLRARVDLISSAMKKTPEEIQASLAPPGAGIPLLNQWLGRFLLKPFVMRRTPWEVSEARFQKVHEKFKRELALFQPQSLTERVLVTPMQGLEDSSRYWSAAMCARHMTIVGKEMEALIVKLTREEGIPRVADTAAVKPELGKNDPSAVQEYIDFADTLIQRIRTSVGNRDARATFAHPWFGPMTAKEWMALYSMHTRVHLGQVRAIRAGLSARL